MTYTTVGAYRRATPGAEYELLKRVERDIEDAMTAARQLQGHHPLTKLLAEVLSLASAWRYDQEAELPTQS